METSRRERLTDIPRSMISALKGKKKKKRKRDTDKSNERKPEPCREAEEGSPMEINCSHSGVVNRLEPECIPSMDDTLNPSGDDPSKPEKDTWSDKILPAENSKGREAELTTLDCDEKLIKDLPSEAKCALTVLLQPKDALGKDYRLLASRLGCSMELINWLESEPEPVMTLINRSGHRKITELISILDDIGRNDVASELRHYMKKTPSPSERKRRDEEFERTRDLQTLLEGYDAFVCFAKNAKEDREFVKELIKRMEGSPYNLKLCWTERDFLGGGFYLENAARVIEERCKKFVVILSKNFDGSDGACYESQIAMTLSPGAKEQRIIPILLEDEYRKTVPKPLAHLTYLDYPRAEGDIPLFWERLAVSLGWIRCRTKFLHPSERVRASQSRSRPRFMPRIGWKRGKFLKKV